MTKKKAFHVWESISDIMTGLMMIFLFISLAFLFELKMETSGYAEIKQQIYVDLCNEFKEEELEKWGAEINRDTTAIYFKSPDIHFAKGDSNVSPKFQAILKDFFPRYLAVLEQEKYEGKIAEIRIEGHASREWNGDPSTDEAYFYNMKLSQERARNVLQYLFQLPEVKEKKSWMRDTMTANGYSYSRAGEDNDFAKRVEFRVVTEAENKLKVMFGD